jgi:hypothetical protein
MESESVIVFERQMRAYQDINLTTQNIFGLLKSVMSGPGRPSGNFIKP